MSCLTASCPPCVSRSAIHEEKRWEEKEEEEGRLSNEKEKTYAHESVDASQQHFPFPLYLTCPLHTTVGAFQADSGDRDRNRQTGQAWNRQVAVQVGSGVYVFFPAGRQ